MPSNIAFTGANEPRDSLLGAAGDRRHVDGRRGLWQRCGTGSLGRPTHRRAGDMDGCRAHRVRRGAPALRIADRYHGRRGSHHRPGWRAGSAGIERSCAGRIRTRRSGPDGRPRAIRRVARPQRRDRPAHVRQRDSARIRRARHGRRAPGRRLRQGHAQRTRLVRPADESTGCALRLGRSPAQRLARLFERDGALVRRPGVGCGIRLAGDRLDRERAAASERRARLRPVGCGHAGVDLARSACGIRTVRLGGPRRLRARRHGGRPLDQLRQGGCALVHRPRRVPVSPGRQLHACHVPSHRSAARHRLRLLPIPGHRSPQRGDRRGRR